MAEVKMVSMAELEANSEAYKVAMLGYMASRGDLPFSEQKMTPAFFVEMFNSPDFSEAFESAKANIAEREANGGIAKTKEGLKARLEKDREEAEKQVAAIKAQAKQPKQANMFDLLQQRSEEAKQRQEAKQQSFFEPDLECEQLADNPNLAPVRHTQRDFFVCDLVDYALKDDQASMEAPIFSLSTREDMKLWTWTSEDGKKSVEVAPGYYGRATQHDKDILIYCASQLTEAINKGLQPSKTVRFTAYDFLVATNRTTGGVGYDRLKDTLNRLSGMRITTNIITGKSRIAKGFGIVDSWEVIEKSPDSDRMIAVEVTLSDWLYNSIQAHEVLTIHPDYFRLRKPLERRLYEIARKHVGKQGAWKIALEALRDKCGSTREVRKFKADLKMIIEADTIPQYRYQLGAGDMITIYDRDPNKALKALL
ncbi:replication initiator protein A [Iodobacter sp. BJB302]|uniref:replication initiator protein A n=1 Tax=Iodobacter sp. BJB302 TaxID=1506510 RepID=UPI000C100ACD|nr:replication initiator protein A [Iodobacter sp. BJB302]PHU99803.1 plasmid replication initiator-like protein [Iodobacter sp. BJB302]